MKENHKYPFTEKQLHEFKSKLEKEQEKIQQRLIKLEQVEMPNLYRGEESNDGYGDDAKNDQIRQRMVQQIKKHQTHLLEIGAALHRIENKTFGLDEKTGQAIRIERLMALPTARVDI